MAGTIVALSTMVETIRRAIQKYPAEQRAIERGALLVALGKVARTGPDTFGVASQTRASVFYTVTVNAEFRATACACEAGQYRPNVACAHRWASELVMVAEERQRRLDRRATYAQLERRFAPLTSEELARLSEWKRRYAAGSKASA